MRPLKASYRTTLLLAAGFALFVFLSAFFHVSDADVGFHMRTAEYILAGHGIPTTNTFSYTTPNEPWQLHQWLGELVFYAPYRLGGVGLLIAFKAFVAVGLMLLVLAAARRLTGPDSLWPFWTVTLGVLIARVRFFERSDLLSALFCAALCYLDLRLGRKRKWQWIGMPLFIALWANTHAGVIYGICLLCAWCAGEWISWFWQARVQKDASARTADKLKSQRELWIRPLGLVLSVFAALVSVQLINPNGARVLWFPISQFGSHFWQSIIDEYQAPSLANNKLFYTTLPALALLQIFTWRRLQPGLLIATLGFGYLACSSQRSILFYVIVAMPYAAFMLVEIVPSIKQARRRIQVLLLPGTWCALVLLLFVPNKTFLFGTGYYHPYYPLEIYRFLKDDVPEQHVFNDMRYGGGMLWWLYPKFKPFVDGRGDAYSVAFWTNQYLPVLEVKPGWQEILNKYSAHAVLIPVLQDGKLSQLASALHKNPDWALVAFDDDTLLFLERTQKNLDLIARHEFRYLWPGDWSFEALNSPATRAAATMEAQRALNFSPHSLFAQTAFARACFVNQQFQKAAEILQSIVSNYDVGENYWRDYGFALFRIGQLKQADKVFAKMIHRRMLPAFSYFMRYYISMREGRRIDAGNYLAEAIKADPDNQQYKDALHRFETNRAADETSQSGH